MRKLLEKARPTVKVRFYGENLDVKKLSLNEIETFQSQMAAVKDQEKEGVRIQKDLIRLAVVDAEDMTDEELGS